MQKIYKAQNLRKTVFVCAEIAAISRLDAQVTVHLRGNPTPLVMQFGTNSTVPDPDSVFHAEQCVKELSAILDSAD